MRTPTGRIGLACRLGAAVVAFGAPFHASAQLTPDRLYFGINRAIPMTVARPAGAEGELSIALVSATDASVVDSAPVPEGRVDLAGLFPSLWTSPAPELHYAQLMAGDKKVGASVVLQPLLTPDYAVLVNVATGEAACASIGGQQTKALFIDDFLEFRVSRNLRPPSKFPPIYSGLRAYVNKDVVFETTEGNIRFRLRPDEAPNTCWNFRELAEGGWYTDIEFHRVIPNFVVQGGDPTGTGGGGPGYMFDLEPSTLPHDFGVLSMARSGDPNSNGSQIFVCLSREATAGLDGQYTSFGSAIGGAETIAAIGSTPLVPGTVDKPANPPRIVKAWLEDAAPFGEGPAPVKAPAPGEPDR
jgi:peptidyl-prolyl cis-trans isomerase B (cyclophilin B)